MKGLNSWHQRYLREIVQFFLLRTKRKALITQFLIRRKISMRWGKNLKMRNQALSRRLRISNRSMTNLWMSSLKAKSTLKEKKLLKTRRSHSRSSALMITIIRWSKLSKDMRSAWRVRKMMLQRFFKSVSHEFNRKKKMLKRNMSRREKLLRILRSRSNRSNHKMIETMLYNWKSTKILKSSKESLSKTWSWIIKNSWNRMRS